MQSHRDAAPRQWDWWPAWTYIAKTSLSPPPPPPSIYHFPLLSLSSLPSTMDRSSVRAGGKLTASIHNLHPPLYFQPKARTSFLQHQFQGRLLIGSAKVTCSPTEPITDAWAIEPSDWSDLRHTPLSLAKCVLRWNPLNSLFSTTATQWNMLICTHSLQAQGVMKASAWTFDESCQS